MGDHGLDDGVVRLREWADDDAAWYADKSQEVKGETWPMLGFTLN